MQIADILKRLYKAAFPKHDKELKLVHKVGGRAWQGTEEQGREIRAELRRQLYMELLKAGAPKQ